MLEKVTCREKREFRLMQMRWYASEYDCHFDHLSPIGERACFVWTDLRLASTQGYRLFALRLTTRGAFGWLWKCVQLLIDMKVASWVVVSNMFLFSPLFGEDSHFDSYFSKGVGSTANQLGMKYPNICLTQSASSCFLSHSLTQLWQSPFRIVNFLAPKKQFCSQKLLEFEVLMNASAKKNSINFIYSLECLKKIQVPNAINISKVNLRMFQ